MNPVVAIPVLTGASVTLFGAGALIAYASRRAPLRARLEGAVSGGQITVSSAPATPTPKLSKVIADLGTFASSGRSSKGLNEQLIQAGYYHRDAAAIYLGAKILLFATGLMFGTLMISRTQLPLQQRLILTAVIGLLFFMVPNASISGRRSRRRRDIRKHLPEAVDLLEVCTSSGMGLDMAWNCVADEIRQVSSVLADEMALTNLEMHLGASRADAMRHMARRTGADELSSLVAVLVQSERFGTSVSDALQTFAAFMRENSSQNAQEAAEKMAVKLIFPMVAMIFPAIVMLMAGPAFLTLYRSIRVH